MAELARYALYDLRSSGLSVEESLAAPNLSKTELLINFGVRGGIYAMEVESIIDDLGLHHRCICSGRTSDYRRLY